MSLAPYSDGFGVEAGVKGCNHGSFAAAEALMVGWQWQSEEHEAAALGKRKERRRDYANEILLPWRPLISLDNTRTCLTALASENRSSGASISRGVS
ncbi:hypothetical protein F0562_008851 [Nyssa sinensis]|uniref:Uncharacterized protein n=1 Tax=Nyssa sinensis TaxID=561372 RepID=A0A5J5A8T7_9ASTE|nr:hypothetical protein F0562_008851 [Nyssa sinensis]